ncbi:MAG TPA: UDP-N-acetylmuramoyl-tripeptide--D-alanyl-D-alanine ligase [Anaeromyxobacteraceae bacterium]|nr:UDP-N-acetylmuramoyl-tripeptide--D-alanyl-D-alanine ligase [Anaeromyxobacteraceae bacterium]
MNAPRFTPTELEEATGGRWASAPPREVAGVSTDTRKISPGALFVALKGESFDGHDFVAQARDAGAGAALVSQAWIEAEAELPRGIPLLAVPDTLRALGAVARAHRRRFAIPLVAVTGSNGKTTTREMIGAILRRRGPALKTDGNLNNEIGVPLTLFGLAADHWAGVVEMGMSNPGEIARLAAMTEPRVGVVTNAAPAHLEGLGTIEGVADAKAELYAALPSDGVAVANADDARVLRRAEASGRRLVTFSVGRARKGDVAAVETLEHGPEGLRFVLAIGNREVEVQLALVGEHNAANAAAAAAAALALGCTDREIVGGLAEVKPVGRRLRVEKLASGVTLVDDCYNANPLSMSAALKTLGELARGGGGRAVAVLGDMLELGVDEEALHRALGADVARTGVALYAAFGPRSRAAAEAARDAGMRQQDVVETEDVAALAATLRERLAPGDVLLVKGSRGMKLERLVEALHHSPEAQR